MLIALCFLFPTEMAQYLEQMGIGVGQDLEEMMVMEAMRLSELEAEEQKKKAAAEEAAKAAAGGARATGANAEAGPSHAPGTAVNAAALSDAIGAPMGSSSPNLAARPIATPAPAATATAGAGAVGGAPTAISTSPVFSAADLDVLQSGAAGRASADGGARAGAGGEGAAEPRADAPLVDI